MPTGSLWAKQNMIGTLLVVKPSLKQEDIVMMVVLAVLLENVVHKDPILSAVAAYPHNPQDNAVVSSNVTIEGGSGGMIQTAILTNCTSVMEEGHADNNKKKWADNVRLAVIYGNDQQSIATLLGPTIPPLNLNIKLIKNSFLINF